MFLFIFWFWYGFYNNCFIQIHPMFLFIYIFRGVMTCLLYSNTSYVLIYRGFNDGFCSSLLYSNTSYVLIYRFLLYLSTIRIWIQIHPMFLFIRWNRNGLKPGKCYSNTSYVLIYHRMAGRHSKFTPAFKYILCSYLSLRFFHMLSLKLSFKYILCSYLSLDSKFCRLQI